MYNVVVHARNELGPEWAKRFCMAHLMFYNVETSVILADVPEKHFWFRALQGYYEAKRGQERRHYRGRNGLASIDSMRSAPPGEVFGAPLASSLVGVERNLKKLGYQGFGNYFMLKWVDFLDVMFLANIDYSGLVNRPKDFLFDGAIKGLESIWPGRPHHESLMEICDYIRQWRDPFQGYRLCGLSEAETIACAYRTYYVKTTYRFGWDINNLHETMDRLTTKSAKILKAGLPKLTKEWR